MKWLLLMSLIFSNSIYAISSQDRFIEAEKRVINKRKEKVIKRISTKLVITYEIIEQSLIFTANQNMVNVSGYTEGLLGVCEIKGTLKLKDTNVIATCISSSDSVTIFFP